MKLILYVLALIGSVLFGLLGVFGILMSFVDQPGVGLGISAFSFIIVFLLIRYMLNERKKRFSAASSQSEAPNVVKAKNSVQENKPVDFLNYEAPLVYSVDDRPDPEEVFPETDAHGLKRLKILTNVKLSGVTQEFNGVNPQTILGYVEDNLETEINLVRVRMDKYPLAVAVSTYDGDHLGWIPEDFYLHDDIATRMDDGATVLANISSIYGGDNGKSYGISINIARYENRKKVLNATANEQTDEITG